MMTALPQLGHRFPDWPTRLNAVVEQARHARFAWTSHNCATFAADCVEAINGVRLHERFAGLMTSARRAVLHAEDIELHVDTALGVERRVPPPRAQRGDVVLVPGLGGPVLAVCLGVSAANAGPTGLTFVPMRGASCAWHV